MASSPDPGPSADDGTGFRTQAVSHRRNHIAALQRLRRSKTRRIDFYPSPQAEALIDRLRKPGIGGDASSILNRIIAEWAAGCGAHVPEFLGADTRETFSPTSGISSVHSARG